jgi:LacI family transcriptional regulator
MSGFEDATLVEELIRGEIPFAVVGREMPSLDINVVSIDNFLGGYIATSHLIQKGHKNIGIIGMNVWSNRERYKGYVKALSENGLSYQKDTIYAKETSIESGKEVAKKLLALSDRPTAIFACNDLLAVGTLEAARETGLKVPGNLSIIGFDDTVWAQSSYPKLTTVAQPIEQMGKKVVDILVQQIEEQKSDKQQVILKPKLVVRESTASTV